MICYHGTSEDNWKEMLKSGYVGQTEEEKHNTLVVKAGVTGVAVGVYEDHLKYLGLSSKVETHWTTDLSIAYNHGSVILAREFPGIKKECKNFTYRRKISIDNLAYYFIKRDIPSLQFKSVRIMYGDYEREVEV